MEPSREVWTVPNLISMVRIGLVFAFGALLVTHHDGWAIAALAAAGASDFLDGYLARRWGQVTALGRILDPTADRLLTIVVVLGLALRTIIPWWLVVILLLRDAAVGAALLVGRSRGVVTPQVTFIGKVATALLYVFLPLAYLAFARWNPVHALAVIGACVAAVLYWWAGLGYVRDVLARVRGAARATPDPDEPTA
ncbi:CDP-alcohol phosphatidyltransferase family protein [Demequina capsici]|uniref:CDP-alcohol phosphatidyltransferase family protein n=1 Tax=Demequina capsici TaxID=3075620 RepID=A0AA96F9I6_9MICO|nr:CDP-alcohol phosphatidyltransferase family protein [Demequina sp. OYTSA14]WNM25822.1 CDP-alcohol phosphatidyltransferase family protein [Demequina sp. OYTSA14]